MHSILSGAIRLSSVAVCVLALAACDPADLARRKVPPPIRDALTFSAQPGGVGGEPAEKPTVTIVSPKDKQAYSPGQEILFRASGKLTGGKSPQPGELFWRLTPVSGEGRLQNWQGDNKKLKLPAGHYKVELTAKWEQPASSSGQQPAKHELTEASSFAVAFVGKGRIRMGAAGLDQAEIAVTDLDKGTVTSKTTSGKNGDFDLRFPSHGSFKIEPQKPGYSFSPLYRRIKFSGERVDLEFTAAKASFTNIRFTVAKDSEEKPQSLCPNEEAYLKLDVVSEVPVVSLEVSLVNPSEAEEEPTVIGEVTDPKAIPSGTDPNAPKYLMVKMPTSWKQHHVKESLRLRVTARDQADSRFSAESPDPIVVDLGVCMTTRAAKALQLYDKGDLESSLRLFSSSLDLEKNLVATDEIQYAAAKNSFNAGLVALESALKSPADSPNVSAYLGKALNLFTDVVRSSPRDPQALLLRGLARQLRGDYVTALTDYDAVMKITPRMAIAHKLKGLALVRSARPGSVDEAVDAFTEALTLDQGDTHIRNARKSALKLALGEESGKGDENAKQVTMPSVRDLFDPRALVRK
ncbi:MAG: tetratricopeptide repeat protein [Thermodesulfobacteriota bacterium]